MEIVKTVDVRVQINVPAFANFVVMEDLGDQYLIKLMSNARWRFESDSEMFSGHPGVFDLKVNKSEVYTVEVL